MNNESSYELQDLAVVVQNKIGQAPPIVLSVSVTRQ